MNYCNNIFGLSQGRYHLIIAFFFFVSLTVFMNNKVNGDTQLYSLPQPVFDSDTSVETALQNRRSIRSYTSQSVSVQNLSQILWAAQGITNDNGYRTAPSGGALYPLDVYVVIDENVDDIAPGIYRYIPQSHSIEKQREGAMLQDLAGEALGQDQVHQAAFSIVIVAVWDRITSKYGERGKQYALIETGHVGQNIYLQAETLGLGTVSVGAFSDSGVAEVLGLDDGATPVYIMPVGHPAQ